MLFTQIRPCRIMRWDPETRSCAVIGKHGLYKRADARPAWGLYACQGGARRMVRFEPDGAVTVLADRYEGKRLNLPNDLAIDLRGPHLVSPDPWYEGAAGPSTKDRSRWSSITSPSTGSIHGPTAAWPITRVTFDTTRPNGLLFSLDHRTLYVAQSGGAATKKPASSGPIPSGTTDRWAPAAVLHDFGEWRGIDGMVLGCGGNIVATAGTDAGGSGTDRFTSSRLRGRSSKSTRLPCPQTAHQLHRLGRPGPETLYVTSIDGHLFRAPTRRQGRLLYPPAGNFDT